ncbi:hypothetical protein IF803_04215 [Bradyrhizobium sp. UFLA06-06]
MSSPNRFRAGRNQGPSPTTEVAGCRNTARPNLEIEEHFGGFNFGGGNGQRDLASIEFDWARAVEAAAHSSRAFIAHSPKEQTARNRKSTGTSHMLSRCRRGQC